tara:strand:+ start:403 stop:702 length:300 start_codon:yes stop_codon:yes gene_type:complete
MKIDKSSKLIPKHIGFEDFLLIGFHHKERIKNSNRVIDFLYSLGIKEERIELEKKWEQFLKKEAKNYKRRRKYHLDKAKANWIITCLKQEKIKELKDEI